MELTNEQSKYILDWAQAQFDAMPDGEYGGDWWGSIIDSDAGMYYDINIYDYTYSDGITKIIVTAYSLSEGKDGWEVDYSVFVRVGTIDLPTRFYVGLSCDLCGDPMEGKYDGDIPTRFSESEVGHLRCVYEMEKAQ